MSFLSIHTDLSVLTAIIPKEKNMVCIQAAQDGGALMGSLTNARGMVRRKKQGWFTPPAISPAMDIIRLLVPTKQAETSVKSVVHQLQLNATTSGAVFTLPISRLWSAGDAIDDHKEGQLPEGAEHIRLQTNLRLITCICQRGKGEIIANAAMSAGSPGPSIFFGIGKGVRERMGLLRIAVSPEKELINVIVGELEVYQVFDAMVEAGKLDTPGMGFIYIMDVPTGFVNLPSTMGDHRSEASFEQMIRAIDELKGDKNWRLNNKGVTGAIKPKRKHLLDLMKIRVVTRRGLGDEFTSAAMNAGAPGASISYANLVGGEKVKGKTGRVVNDEREILDFIVGKDKIDGIVAACDTVANEVQSKNTFLYELPVPKALTFLG